MCCKSTLERRHPETRNTTLCRLKCVVERHLEQKLKDSFSRREIEMRTDLQHELRAKEKRKKKANTMPKTTPREETAHGGPRKANAQLEIR